jgi:hypothetical protein
MQVVLCQRTKPRHGPRQKHSSGKTPHGGEAARYVAVSKQDIGGCDFGFSDSVFGLRMFVQVGDAEFCTQQELETRTCGFPVTPQAQRFDPARKQWECTGPSS